MWRAAVSDSRHQRSAWCTFSSKAEHNPCSTLNSCTNSRIIIRIIMIIRMIIIIIINKRHATLSAPAPMTEGSTSSLHKKEKQRLRHLYSGVVYGDKCVEHCPPSSLHNNFTSMRMTACRPCCSELSFHSVHAAAESWSFSGTFRCGFCFNRT